MKNLKIAKIFFEIADILEIKEVEWKPQAYKKAARAIESLSDDVSDIYNKKGLKGLDEIPGVGERLAKKIEEYIKTGKIREYEKLKKSLPKGFTELMKVPGMGPKKIKELHKKLGIKNVKELEKAAKKHKISKLARFKEKSEENILEGIKLIKTSKGRFLLGKVYPLAEEIRDRLIKIQGVKKAVPGGSLRRMEETIGDIDILVSSSDPKKVMDFFVAMPEVKKILAKGITKSSVIFDNNIQVDIRVIPEKSFGAALQYFTGNKAHNIKLREIAIKKGYKLSEYGLFKENKYVVGKTEKEIYNKLGFGYIDPEMRRNFNELNIKKIPKVISLEDIKGDLHVHSKYSDGVNSIKEMADYCKKLGYSYMCMSDHSVSQKIANGMSEERLMRQLKEIDKLNKNYKNFKILKGIEVDILKDGSLDLSEKMLKKLDIVTGSIHSGFKMSKIKMTNRIIKALENKYLNVLGHPSGRLINQRDPYDVDLDSVFRVARENKKFIEINSNIYRLDLKAEDIKKAISHNVKLVLGTDAHSVDNLDFMRYGVAQARAGMATKKEIINCLSLSELKKVLKR